MLKSSFEETPIEESCGDSVVVGVNPTVEHVNPICTESLTLIPISSPLLPTTPSDLHALYESLGDLRGYNLSFDPYCAYLKDMLGKIMLSIFFDHAFNFSMVFDMLSLIHI